MRQAKPCSFLLVLVACIPLISACPDSGGEPGGQAFQPQTVMPPGLRVPVAVYPSEQDGSLDERYLGFAFDTAQFTGGYWWRQGHGERQPEETPDLESPKLRRLASYLAPSLMRIGGTDCDGAYFCPEEGDCELPERYEDAWRDKEERIATFFTHEDIRRAANFAEAVGARIMFCINVGAGPRDPETGLWNPDNARLLVQYAKSLPNGHVFEIWEPGNEVNFLTFHLFTPRPVTPWLFAEDVATFRTLINQEAGGNLVASPGCYFLPFRSLGDIHFTEDLFRLAHDRIDILTWHLYATQSERCFAVPVPATRENLFRKSVVDTHRSFARYARRAAGGKPVMNGESASCQCGGQAGVSDTLLDALWYADWIGIMAEEGTSSVVRQTLVGSEYGMLDPDTFDPRPTFLANILFRRTVERARLKTEAARALVKAHGFCATGGTGAVTTVLSNPSDETLAVEITLAGSTVNQARQWTIGANGDLGAHRATIEGLPSREDGSVPEPPGTPVHLEQGKAYAKVGPNSLVFVKLEAAERASACR